MLTMPAMVVKIVMLTMLAIVTKKCNPDNAGDGGAKTQMLAMPAMVAQKSLMLVMVAKKVYCWQCW